MDVRVAASRGRYLPTVMALGLLVAVGVGFRCVGMTTRSLWFDEAFSWRLSQDLPAELIARTARDDNPPLYYLLLKAWGTLFGTSSVALRAFSVLCGGLTILGMYGFVREALPDREGRPRPGLALFVAALVAASALHIRWAWDVRMYTLGTALAAFSSWALLRAVRATPPRRGPWFVYAALALTLAYTHTCALLFLAAQALFVLGWAVVHRRDRATALAQRAWPAYALLCVGFLPWLPVVLRQRTQVRADHWTGPLSWEYVHWACQEMVLLPEGVPLFRRLYPWLAPLSTAVLGLVLLALLGRAVLRKRPENAGAWYCWCAAALPFALALVLAWSGTNIVIARYFLFGHLFVLAAVGALVWRLPGCWLRGGVAGLLVAGGLAADWRFVHALNLPARPGMRALAGWINDRRGPDEPVVASSPFYYLPLLYYSHERAGCYLYDYGEELKHFHGIAALNPNDYLTAKQLRHLPARRVWVVHMYGSHGCWGPRFVPVPAHWRATECRSFAEAFTFQGHILAVAYETGRDLPGGGVE